MSRNLKKLIEQNACQHPPVKIFSDFAEMSALAVRNSVDVDKYEEREKRYLHLIGQYEKDEQKRFGEMFSELVNEMEQNPRDVLGVPAMVVHGNTLSLQTYDHWFTPMHILHGWTWRLRKGKNPRESHETDVFPPVPPGPGSVQGLKPGQLSLF